MTKSDVVDEIVHLTGVDKITVQACVEGFLSTVSASLAQGEPVFLRGFGSFIIKTRAQKIGRNISKNTQLVIPEHKIAAFKPAQALSEKVK